MRELFEETGTTPTGPVVPIYTTDVGMDHAVAVYRTSVAGDIRPELGRFRGVDRSRRLGLGDQGKYPYYNTMALRAHAVRVFVVGPSGAGRAVAAAAPSGASIGAITENALRVLAAEPLRTVRSVERQLPALAEYVVVDGICSPLDLAMVASAAYGIHVDSECRNLLKSDERRGLDPPEPKEFDDDVS